MRLTLYMRPSTSTGHLPHTEEVLTNPDVGVDTTRSNGSSHTGRPNSRTQDSDTNECVAPESKRTQQALPEITQQPTTRLHAPAASDPIIAKTLHVA